MINLNEEESINILERGSYIEQTSNCIEKIYQKKRHIQMLYNDELSHWVTSYYDGRNNLIIYDSFNIKELYDCLKNS